MYFDLIKPDIYSNLAAIKQNTLKRMLPLTDELSAHISRATKQSFGGALFYAKPILASMQT